MYIIIIIIKIRRLTAVQAGNGGAATVVAYHRLAEARVDLKQVLSCYWSL